jgi:transcriptional regulator with XRE-family HTH domain
MTQETLARRAKVTPKFISQIENGRVNPSIGVLERIVVDGLRLTLGMFFLWHPDAAESRRRVLRVVAVLCDDDAT